jgi:Xaa-Pro dipeptidase
MTEMEPEAAVLPQSELDLVRRVAAYGLERTQAALRRHGLPAALLLDSCNIRYATGTSIMPVWTLHALDRYVLVPVEGRPVLWEYASVRNAPDPEAIPVIRQAASWTVFNAGSRSAERAKDFAAEVVRTLQEMGLAEGLLGVDRLDTDGFLALQAAGLTLRPAQTAMEQARSVKSAAEIELIRRSVAVCDAAITHLYTNLRPGMTENEAWALFTGHAFANGAEYVECRLLSSGPRTNPWFQEATDRPIEAGDIVSFDTDLIGPAGYLADLSRAYVVGDGKPSARQRRLYHDAEQFLHEIRGELRPGASLAELGERLSGRFPRKYHPQRYPFIAHSSGLSDEYPTIVFEDHDESEAQPGMVFSIEAYVGEEGEPEGIKLEEQVLLTPAGVEVLSQAPHDPRLTG